MGASVPFAYLLLGLDCNGGDFNSLLGDAICMVFVFCYHPCRHEREINSQDLGKRLRASRKTKRQARKGNIAARPAAGLPMDTQRYASRSSARLRGLPSVSSTGGSACTHV